jgi:hypothetical protein
MIFRADIVLKKNYNEKYHGDKIKTRIFKKWEEIKYKKTKKIRISEVNRNEIRTVSHTLAPSRFILIMIKHENVDPNRFLRTTNNKYRKETS